MRWGGNHNFYAKLSKMFRLQQNIMRQPKKEETVTYTQENKQSIEIVSEEAQMLKSRDKDSEITIIKVFKYKNSNNNKK